MLWTSQTSEWPRNCQEKDDAPWRLAEGEGQRMGFALSWWQGGGEPRSLTIAGLGEWLLAGQFLEQCDEM
jgi:hypothetical protein